ncbi:uncharacterized protein ARB_02880 [Trichophyton benhamiae CBS 112371]|uniref:Uncharacterized protein n=1 Tax=Arthroderma benhamiae (strain ATCC MYA-4681 / CBS 112371) TaxID=663331 RepID=D4B346_ARTBC|nr:uncharacterized protein ARB_02880 [Trichophyton benhamiae CBS 112371]EFE30201.1 hypothetical protein ARB_02880 [Trichophyton benhamiae CBS 112371]
MYDDDVYDTQSAGYINPVVTPKHQKGGGGLAYDSSIEVDEADERAGEADDDDDDDDDEGPWITGPRDLAAFEIPETTEAYLPLVA